MEKNDWRYRDFGHLALRGFPRLGIGSIDVTYRCNLNCQHCYFKGQGHQDEQPLSFWVDKFAELKERGFPFLICGWLGGEPLLRPEIVEHGRKYFKSNVIFTNGTLELPPWPESTFVVSVHGSAADYQAMTGKDEKTYQKVKRHASQPDLKVQVCYCVTPLNQEGIESFVEEWWETGVTGITFEFYTPTGNPRDKDLTLDWEARDRVLSRVRRLKDAYGDFIYNSPLTLKLMASDKSKNITRNCPFLGMGFCFDPMGREKEQCTLGPDADCERCGCILPFFSEILYTRRYIFKEFISATIKEYKRHLNGHPGHKFMT